MTLRDRLCRLMDEENPVELYFAPSHNYYLAKLTQVGQDFIEFDALDEDETIVAHNIMPLNLLVGVTTSSTERNREKLELLYKMDLEGEQHRS